jgi:hypothetical protein
MNEWRHHNALDSAQVPTDLTFTVTPAPPPLSSLSKTELHAISLALRYPEYQEAIVAAVWDKADSLSRYLESQKGQLNKAEVISKVEEARSQAPEQGTVSVSLRGAHSVRCGPCLSSF